MHILYYASFFPFLSRHSFNRRLLFQMALQIRKWISRHFSFRQRERERRDLPRVCLESWLPLVFVRLSMCLADCIYAVCILIEPLNRNQLSNQVPLLLCAVVFHSFFHGFASGHTHRHTDTHATDSIVTRRWPLHRIRRQPQLRLVGINNRFTRRRLLRPLLL